MLQTDAIQGKLYGVFLPVLAYLNLKITKLVAKVKNYAPLQNFNECYLDSLRVRLRSDITCGNSGQVIYCRK